MARKKRQRFEEILNMPNVLTFTDPAFLEKARERFRDQRIMVELACGKGEYALAMAREHPEALCIGIDIKGDRLWHGATRALQERLDNVLFLRMNIERLTAVFAPHSVSAIWITFPDPFPRKRHVKMRLTSPHFLAMYSSVLTPNAEVSLKTDSDSLMTYTVATLREFKIPIVRYVHDTRIFDDEPAPSTYGELMEEQQETPSALFKTRTFYEDRNRALKKRIHYIVFTPQRHLQGSFS